MATARSSLCLVLMSICVATVFTEESPELSRIEMASTNHHQAQKRSAPLDPSVSSSFDPDEEDRAILNDAAAAGIYESPYDSLDKRSSLFRFGKRGGSLFRFGKRGGSLFRFGKRDGTLFRFGKRNSLFRFGKRGQTASAAAAVQDFLEDKRNNLFRFGKRSGDSEYLQDLLQRYADDQPSSYDVDRKRNVNSFHWGDSEK